VSLDPSKSLAHTNTVLGMMTPAKRPTNSAAMRLARSSSGHPIEQKIYADGQARVATVSPGRSAHWTNLFPVSSGNGRLSHDVRSPPGISLASLSPDRYFGRRQNVFPVSIGGYDP
jgi:hypothetical protein